METSIKTVGIIVQSISMQSQHDFFDNLSKKFSEKNCDVMIKITNGNIETERESFTQFGKITDAIIVISAAKNYDEISDVVPTDIPVIFLLTQPEGCNRTCILESDYSAIYQGIISCSNNGENKVAFVYSNMENTATQECLKSYKDALNAIEEGLYDESLLFEVADPNTFNPRTLLNQIITSGCNAILTTSSTLTSSLIDCLMFSSKESESALSIMGYGPNESLLSSQMYVDLIVQPLDEILELTVQQVLYKTNHSRNYSDQKNRVYRLKSTLRMHHKTIS